MAGRSHPLTRPAVVKAAMAALEGERRAAILSISFLSRHRMCALNRRWKGKNRPTDVLAFPLEGPGRSLAGDIYICPWVAVRSARDAGVPVPEELARLVIHGVLHVLGHDHPEGAGRTTGPMWRRQERCLRTLR